MFCSACSRFDALRERNEGERHAALSQVEHNRRLRQLEYWKRILSAYDMRWRKRRADSQSQSSLLTKLPAELRIKIYEELLVNTEEIHIIPGRLLWDSLNVRSEHRFFPQILRTCRQMYVPIPVLLSLTYIYLSSYREALPVLYANNIFTFHSATPLFAFTARTPPQQLSWIRTFIFATVLLKDAGNYYSESLYNDPFSSLFYKKLLKLFGKLLGKRTVCLSYRIANKSYMRNPRLSDFALLSKFEEGKNMKNVIMFYEIVGALGEDEGRLMCGRWKVGERVEIK
jgi:hypothetical protein